MDPFLDFVVLLTHKALLSKNMYIVSETINLSLLFAAFRAARPNCSRLLACDGQPGNFKLEDFRRVVQCDAQHARGRLFQSTAAGSPFATHRHALTLSQALLENTAVMTLACDVFVLQHLLAVPKMVQFLVAYFSKVAPRADASLSLTHLRHRLLATPRL